MLTNSVKYRALFKSLRNIYRNEHQPTTWFYFFPRRKKEFLSWNDLWINCEIPKWRTLSPNPRVFQSSQLLMESSLCVCDIQRRIMSYELFRRSLEIKKSSFEWSDETENHLFGKELSRWFYCILWMSVFNQLLCKRWTGNGKFYINLICVISILYLL